MTQYQASSELQVTKGELSAEELAALVVVLRHQAHHQDELDRIKPEWNAPHRNIRRHFEHGPAMWRRSALPH